MHAVRELDLSTVIIDKVLNEVIGQTALQITKRVQVEFGWSVTKQQVQRVLYDGQKAGTTRMGVQTQPPQWLRTTRSQIQSQESAKSDAAKVTESHHSDEKEIKQEVNAFMSAFPSPLPVYIPLPSAAFLSRASASSSTPKTETEAKQASQYHIGLRALSPNPVGSLQEWAVANKLYCQYTETAADMSKPHQPVFSVRVQVGEFKEEATASSKKQAKHDAARQCILLIRGKVAE